MAADAPAPWVRVVVVNYDGGDLLAAAIAGLASQTDSAFEAVVVDNASTDGSIDRLALPDPRFRVVHAGANIGFAAGCNLGARGAATPWLAMLNPDAVPAPGWLAAIRQAVDRYPDVAMFGSTQLSAADARLLDGAGDAYSILGIAWRGGFGAPAAQVTADMPAFSPCAAAAFYRRDAFAAAGGFAEPFFCYLEDVDLAFRLRLAGHRAIQVAAARVAHAGSGIAGRHSAFTIRHSARNGVWLLARCMPVPLLPLALPLYLAAQLWLAARMPDCAPARMRGLAQGLAALPRRLAERRTIRRRLGWLAVARLLVWDPRKVSRRAIVATV